MTKEEILELAEKAKECGVPGRLILHKYVRVVNLEKSHTDYDNLEITNKGKILLGKEVKDMELLWINEYRDKFKNCNPDRIGDKQNCIKNMKTFMEIYDYTKEQIMEATDNYIYQLTDFNYIMKADLFISKYENGVYKSRLLNYCENLSKIDNKWQ